MENNVRKILMDRPLVIPRIIINNYKKLNITEEELIILIFIINFIPSAFKILNPFSVFTHKIFANPLVFHKGTVRTGIVIANPLVPHQFAAFVSIPDTTNILPDCLSCSLRPLRHTKHRKHHCEYCQYDSSFSLHYLSFPPHLSKLICN